MKAVAATGMLGTGFSIESLSAAAVDADFIGCDAGSTDPGPYYLGSGKPQVARDAAARDMEAILAAALPRKIPVVVGSAGTAGGRPHLEWMRELVRELARTNHWSFRLATIDSELENDWMLEQYREGRLTPLKAAPELDEETLGGAERIVAMMGAEPFQRALREGADVVVAGRSSDTSIYAAVPIERGIPKVVAWHAGKVLECGAASAERRIHPDSMAAELDDEGFTIAPPNPEMRCTPASVISHSLYETSDPHRLVEPGGSLDTSECVYRAVDDRTVRVVGGRFTSAPQYTVRLEGATLAGYRSVAIGGVRDPIIVRQLDPFLAEAEAVIRRKVTASLGVADGDYTLRWRVYGRDGSMGELEVVRETGHEVGVVIDVVGRTQEQAAAILSIAWHTALHHPVPEYSGLISNLAFPYSPPGMDAGPAYRFCLNHALTLDDGHDLFPIEMERL